MKKSLLVLAALVIAYCAAAYFIGVKADSALSARMEQTKADAPLLNYTLKQKQPGIFHSSYTYGLEYPLPPETGKAGPNRLISLDMTMDVTHGPIVLGSEPGLCLAQAAFTFSVNPSTSQDIRDFLAQVPELAQANSRMRIGFDMSGVTTVTVSGANRTFQAQPGKPLTVEWQPLTAVIVSNADATRYTMTGQLPSLRLQDADSSATVAGLRINADSTRLRGRIWTGSYKFSLDTFDVRPTAPQAPFRLDKAYMNLDLVPKGETLEYTASVGGIGANAAGMKFPLSVDMLFRNLDIAALDDLQNLLQQQQDPNPATAKPGQADFLRVTGAMLARSPEIEMTVKALEGDWGPVTLQASVKTENMKEVPAHPLLALPKLRAQAKLDGPAPGVLEMTCLLVQDGAKRPSSDPAFRKEMSLLLDQLVLQGYLVPSGGRLTSEASWDGAGLTVNGKRLQ